MCGRVRSIVIGRHSTFLELKARMFGQQGGRILLFKTAVGGSKTRLQDTQHIGSHTKDQDMLSAIEKMEGGGGHSKVIKTVDKVGQRQKKSYNDSTERCLRVESWAGSGVLCGSCFARCIKLGWVSVVSCSGHVVLQLLILVLFFFP